MRIKILSQLPVFMFLSDLATFLFIYFTSVRSNKAMTKTEKGHGNGAGFRMRPKLRKNYSTLLVIK